jgi:hypothetical protein
MDISAAVIDAESSWVRRKFVTAADRADYFLTHTLSKHDVSSFVDF